MTLFDSVLVANRGEIAVRVMQTCRKLGIRTIAVYSDADTRALHAVVADEAHRIGPPPAAESYLNQAAILRVARETGAQALHPGYGFLAENAEFAQACLDAGIVWIGPSPEAMRTLGDKAKAKALAERVGVPLLPGYHGENQEPDFLAKRAEKIGYPVLIKASAGGGGRGMRVVEGPAEFADALEAARREAIASFGDGRVLLERYVRRPRHVEVQILGDQYGNVVHLGERECSIQRRYQKLIEESPSPAVDEALRARLGEAALALARAANYSNAGTVEFLLDEERNYYFLEVNARLQVEHPVTEEVTGLDLVELQLRVAAGEPLALRQEDVRLKGHAIEARVIAEDPLKGFLPSAGTITKLNMYYAVRNESGIQEGSVVSPYYDSLLIKIIAKSDYSDSPRQNREDAGHLLATALDEARVEGVETNLDLLLAVVQQPAFQVGDLHTGFLQEHQIIESLSKIPAEVVAALAVATTQAPEYRYAEADPWRGGSAWRLLGMNQPSRWNISGTPVEARVTREIDSDALSVQVGGLRLNATYLGRIPRCDHGVRVGNAVAEVNVGHMMDGECVVWKGRNYRLRREDPLEHDRVHGGGHGAAGLGSLTAPMPGRIVKVAVAEGDRVKANQPLIVLEAMKMEHVVDAPHEGVVRRLHVRQGEQVPGGTVLVELAEEEE